MGLTKSSTGNGLLSNDFQNIKKTNGYTIALAGNPNVGKSTIFNSLTGMHQHTGNWPGKTVSNATGNCSYKGTDFLFVDIPGTYSIMSNSEEEEIARDYICFGNPDVTIVVVDATCLERNLNLVFQIMEITNNVVLCINLLDEAKKKKIKIDLDKLSSLLGIPVVGTTARNSNTLNTLIDTVYKVCKKQIIPTPKRVSYDSFIEKELETLQENIIIQYNFKNCQNSKSHPSKLDSKFSNNSKSNYNSILHSNLARWISLKLLDGEEKILSSIEKNLSIDLTNNETIRTIKNRSLDNLSTHKINKNTFRDTIVSSIMNKAESICKDVCTFENENYSNKDRKIDKILTSKKFGIPIMIAFLALIFWITIVGANYPSQVLFTIFSWIQDKLIIGAKLINLPEWFSNMIILGVYQTLTWVISVMLPPMAIFFPLFTFLEDLGYLPRIAFNMDGFFKKCCCSGKQMITMCMGFGCNAAGCVGCRIIDSPRERLIAILTNSFVPCNRKIPNLDIYRYNIYCWRDTRNWSIIHFYFFCYISSYIRNFLNTYNFKNTIKNNFKRNAFFFCTRIATI